MTKSTNAGRKIDSFPPDLNELVQYISELPEEYRTKLNPAVTRVQESVRRRRRILGLVQEALSQLRLDMKYLMFDLEATRRERDALKAELDRIDEE
jgi:hypothetical protein